MPVAQPKRARRRSGLSLVEAALFISLFGVLLAVFIPSFLRHVRTSKIGEATETLSELSRLSVAYFSTTHDTNDGLRSHCLPPPGGPVPAFPSTEPAPVSLSEQTSFGALGFTDGPQGYRYRYSFLPVVDGCGVTRHRNFPLVVLRAEGDLDDDGSLSTFERTLNITTAGNLEPSGALFVRGRVE